MLVLRFEKKGIYIGTEVGADVHTGQQQECDGDYKSEVDKALVFLIHQAQVGAWFHVTIV